MYKRLLHIDIIENNAFFLWGPRKTGKTTLLRQQFPGAKLYDLLQNDLYARLVKAPQQLREEVVAQQPELVIVDEVQKIPALLDEIHWCLENAPTKFILCGSSARKLRRGAGNLLGGRAWRYELFGLTTPEMGEPDLLRILNHGCIPQHYQSNNPDRFLRAYVADYLTEEIQAEALTRNIPAFAKFLESVAFNHGELLNYANVGKDCGASPKTVRAYYQILEDTLLGHTLEPWRKSRDRRLIETAKFYLFDPGVVRALQGFPRIQERTDAFGRSFEHFIIEEVRAYLSYREKAHRLHYWRTSTGLEVDLIVGDLELAIECKSTDSVRPKHLRGLRALCADQDVQQSILVSCDLSERVVDNVQLLPWQVFCERLWQGEFV